MLGAGPGGGPAARGGGDPGGGAGARPGLGCRRRCGVGEGRGAAGGEAAGWEARGRLRGRLGGREVGVMGGCHPPRRPRESPLPVRSRWSGGSAPPWRPAPPRPAGCARLSSHPFSEMSAGSKAAGKGGEPNLFG